MKRAIYYAARELSAQLGVVTGNANYDDLEKENLMGVCDESEAYHDLLEVVIVRRGAEPLENTLFEYLQGVFTTNFDTINKYVDVENNKEVKEVLKTMCGYNFILVPCSLMKP